MQENNAAHDLMVEAPDFSPGKRVFSPRKSRYRKVRALALVAMHLAPQEIRTFFITSVASGRRDILQSDRMAGLLIDVMQENRKKGRFLLHEFVVMPNHFHLLITPAHEVPLEKAIQYIKGGFSFRVKKELNFNYAVWQESFRDHRIRNAEDYANHKAYVLENPVRAKLVPRAELFPYSSAYPGTASGCGATRAEAQSVAHQGSRTGLKACAPRTKVRGFHPSC